MKDSHLSFDSQFSTWIIAEIPHISSSNFFFAVFLACCLCGGEEPEGSALASLTQSPFSDHPENNIKIYL